MLCQAILLCYLCCCAASQQTTQQQTEQQLLQAEQQQKLITTFTFPRYLTERLYVDRYNEGQTIALNFSLSLSDSYHNYASLCQHMLPPGSSAELLSGCYSDMVFTARNMVLRYVQELSYSALFAATNAIPVLQVHAHAGVLLAATYAYMNDYAYNANQMVQPASKQPITDDVKADSVSSLASKTKDLFSSLSNSLKFSFSTTTETEKLKQQINIGDDKASPEKFCLFGKFSLKITIYFLTFFNKEIIIFSELDVSNKYFLDLMTMLELTAKLNRRSITINQNGINVFKYDPIANMSINDKTLLNKEPIKCDSLFVWGSENLLRKSITKYANKASNYSQESEISVLYVNEFDPKQTLNNKRIARKSKAKSNSIDNNANALSKRFRVLRDEVNWVGSLHWPTDTAIQTRRNVLGHVQQEYELSVVANSTQSDCWLGYVRSSTTVADERSCNRLLRVDHVEHKSSRSSIAMDKKQLLEQLVADVARAGNSIPSALTISSSATAPTINNRCTCHEGKHSYLIIISYTNEIFLHNALGLQRAIRSLSIADVIATGDFTLDRLQQHLHTRHFNRCKVLQIVIGPHEPNWLLENYIVYDAEQVWSIFMEIPSYISILEDAKAIFVMSSRHSKKYDQISMRREGIDEGEESDRIVDKKRFDVYAIPFYTALPAERGVDVSSGINSNDDRGNCSINSSNGFIDMHIEEVVRNSHGSSQLPDPILAAVLTDAANTSSTSANASYCSNATNISSESSSVVLDGFKLTPLHISRIDTQYQPATPVDILFFGSCSDHRREFISILNSYHDMHTSRGKHRPLHMNLKCIRDWRQALIGSRRDIVVRKAAVVVNIHVFPESSLEVHRLNYLLALGKCVVSERSLHDPQLDEEYSDGVIFGNNFEDIVEKIFSILTNESHRLQCQQNAVLRYNRTMNDTSQLKLALANVLKDI